MKSLPSMRLAAFVEFDTAVGVRVRMYSHRTKSSNECGSSSGMVSLSSRDSLNPELKADLKKSEMPDKRFSCNLKGTSLGPTSTVTTRSENNLLAMTGQYQDTLRDAPLGRDPNVVRDWW